MTTNILDYDPSAYLYNPQNTYDPYKAYAQQYITQSPTTSYAPPTRTSSPTPAYAQPYAPTNNQNQMQMYAERLAMLQREQERARAEAEARARAEAAARAEAERLAQIAREKRYGAQEVSGRPRLEPPTGGLNSQYSPNQLAQQATPDWAKNYSPSQVQFPLGNNQGTPVTGRPYGANVPINPVYGYWGNNQRFQQGVPENPVYGYWGNQNSPYSWHGPDPIRPPGPYQGQLSPYFYQHLYGPGNFDKPVNNPPGPRGQKGPYTPQDERQWAYDRDTNEQFQGVTKEYESNLYYGIEQQPAPAPAPAPSYPGYPGYPGYPEYPTRSYRNESRGSRNSRQGNYYPGGGYGGGSRYTGYNQGSYGRGSGGGGFNPVRSWYENMLQWRIGG